MISFLHAADLHLGMRVTRLDPDIAAKVREARMTALDHLLHQAKELRVDFVLLAGDVFDDLAVDAGAARRAFDLLEAQPMPIFVLPGNHDPLVPGGVWERPPWNQASSGQLRLLTQNEPWEIAPGVVLLPCPLRRKTSLDDPTAWIAQAAPAAQGAVRIGVAHGSLRARDPLPPDDHLIARHAASDLKLDYLALGHWHSRQLFADRDGVERTAYSGVHEPIGFSGSMDNRTGWAPHGDRARAEFRDRGQGEALHVRLAGPGAAPVIEPVAVGHLAWQEEEWQLSPAGEDLNRLIDNVATRENTERRLLRLKLTGVLDAEGMLKLDALRDILAHRYFLGDMETSGLHLEPSDQQIRDVAGQGVLGRVLELLGQETKGTDAAASQVAERALLLLYQIARRAQA